MYAPAHPPSCRGPFVHVYISIYASRRFVYEKYPKIGQRYQNRRSLETLTPVGQRNDMSRKLSNQAECKKS